MLPFSPAVYHALIAAYEARVATAGDLAYVAHGYVLNEDRRIFVSNRIVYAQLPKLIRTHRVHIVIVSYKACMAVTTSYQANRDIVGAELGEGINLISSQTDTEAKLALIVGTP